MTQETFRETDHQTASQIYRTPRRKQWNKAQHRFLPHVCHQNFVSSGWSQFLSPAPCVSAGVRASTCVRVSACVWSEIPNPPSRGPRGGARQRRTLQGIFSTGRRTAPARKRVGGEVSVLGLWAALSLSQRGQQYILAGRGSNTGRSELEERAQSRGRDQSELDRPPHSSRAALLRSQLYALTSWVGPDLSLPTGVVVARSVKRLLAQTRN